MCFCASTTASNQNMFRVIMDPNETYTSYISPIRLVHSAALGNIIKSHPRTQNMCLSHNPSELSLIRTDFQSVQTLKHRKKKKQRKSNFLSNSRRNSKQRRFTWRFPSFILLSWYSNIKMSVGHVLDGRIILRWILRKWEGVVGTGWSWLRIGTGGGRLWVR